MYLPLERCSSIRRTVLLTQLTEHNVNSPSSTGAIGLAAAGLLIGAGGVLHPRVETSVEFDQGLAGMFESSAWSASHLVTMAGFLVLALSLAALANGSLRVVGRIAAVAAGFAAVETVPHLLAASEPSLADVHTVLQAFSTPLVGLSLAALALVGHRSGELDAGRIGTALAVVGGCLFALAGPAIAITHDSGLSPLFAGSAGLAIWAVVAGARQLTPAPALAR
jgi:hypothetical protein